METTPKQQFLRAIQQSQNILLLTHEHIDGDGLGGMAALSYALKKIGKNVTLFSYDPIPQALKFLPDVDEIMSKNINLSQDFIISLTSEYAQVEKLKYNVVGKTLNILLTPKSGQFTEEDVHFSRGKSAFDTIIVIDAGDKEQLGKIYRDNPSLFYESLVINIDHHVTNTDFGEINIVDPKATSSCEIILGLIEALSTQYGQKLFSPEIATYLLTGVTVDTNSFQNTNTTPKAFSVAAQLLAMGGDQQLIIKNLYKTNSLSKLRLWGRALSNIREDKESGLVWSVIRMDDYTATNAHEDEIHGVLDELITSAPGADIVFLIREIEPGMAHCSIRTLGLTDASELAGFFHGGGHRHAAGCKIKGDSLEKIENFVVKRFRDFKLGFDRDDSTIGNKENNISPQIQKNTFDENNGDTDKHYNASDTLLDRTIEAPELKKIGYKQEELHIARPDIQRPTPNRTIHIADISA